MSEFPHLSGAELVRALEKLGFSVRRQQGSHIVMRRAEPFAQTVVPNHKQVDRGTLRAILRQTNLTLDELKACL